MRRPHSASGAANVAAPGLRPTGPTIQVVVPDADEALAHLRSVGVEARGVEDLAWGRFVTFDDPDGNTWTLQQLPDYGAQG